MHPAKMVEDYVLYHLGVHAYSIGLVMSGQVDVGLKTLEDTNLSNVKNDLGQKVS